MLRGLDEAIIHGFVDESNEVVFVAIHIQQTHKLVIDSKLGLCDDFQ